MFDVESPIVAVVGNKGTGKTLFLTYRAEYAHHIEKRQVFSNYHLTNIPYQPFDYEMLVDMPDHMRDGVIVADEGHMGADAYEFLSSKSKAMTKLATQLRKLNLDLYISTQRFTFLTKRIRSLVDFIVTLEPAKDQHGDPLRGVAIASVFDRDDPFNDDPVSRFIFDGRQFFDHYDTSEIID